MIVQIAVEATIAATNTTSKKTVLLIPVTPISANSEREAILIAGANNAEVIKKAVDENQELLLNYSVFKG
jgi:uncharacterized protein (UPF0216 family)